MPIEGYWRQSETEGSSELPWPVAASGPWEGKEAFLLALEVEEDRLTPKRYRGSSQCRLCRVTNGSGEYTADGWTWPSGLHHYVPSHNVKPSKEFIAFILGRRG